MISRKRGFRVHPRSPTLAVGTVLKMEDESALTAPVFKKRAKSSFKRKHDSSSADDETETSSQHLSVSEILRQRRQGKIRRSAMEASTHEQDDHSRAVAAVASNKEKSDVDKMRNRFVVQTGQVAGLYDKQM